MQDILILLGISVFSTLLGFFLFFKAGVIKSMDTFMVKLGVALNELNTFNLDEDLKLDLSQKHTIKIIGSLLMFTFLLIVSVGLAGLPFLYIKYESYTDWDLIIWITLGVTIGSIVYLKWLHKPEVVEYTAAKKLFYYLTLGVPALTISKAKKRKKRGNLSKAVFVTGLARAGTTTLLHYLFKHPQLSSITYRSMPMLGAPKTWLKFNKVKVEAAERSHKDGIMVSLDSPEAFDEYFWRVATKEKYYTDGGLKEHDITEAELDIFEKMIGAHTTENKFYLSKNNNLILRVSSLLKLRPQMVVALVFRNPFEHAISLLRQHQIQTSEQEKDLFVLDYMNWLGHHEFGKGRRDFIFSNLDYKFTDKNTIEYWLERWLNYYLYASEWFEGLTQESKKQIAWVSNNTIAQQPKVAINKVVNKINLQGDYELPTREPRTINTPKANEALISACQTMYDKLLDLEQKH